MSKWFKKVIIRHWVPTLWLQICVEIFFENAVFAFLFIVR